MNKIGIIVGAAPLGDESEKLLELVKWEDTFTIAADGGIFFFIQNNIVPDMWLGDMDSFEEQGIMVPRAFKEIETKRVSPIKDETDMELGVIKAFEEGCDEVYVFGGLGGRRNSHTIANIQMMHKYAKKDKQITMFGDHTKMFCIHNGGIEFTDKEKGFVSVFALSDEAKGVKISGLFYEYGGTLKDSFALGVSNEFCGKEALISVEEGTLLIVCVN